MHQRKILFNATVEKHLISFHLPFIVNLQKRSYEIHIATKLGERKYELEEKGIIRHNIDFSRSVNPFAALISLVQLIKLMKKNQFSLVHVHTPIASFLGRLSARLTYSKSVLCTVHSFHFYKGALWYYMTFIYLAEYVAGKWTDVSMETM